MCTSGHLFLPDYAYISDTGEWRHRSKLKNKLAGGDRKWLGSISYSTGRFQLPAAASNKMTPPDFMEVLRLAQQLASRTTLDQPLYPDPPKGAQSDRHARLRWYLTASDGASLDGGMRNAGGLASICPSTASAFLASGAKSTNQQLVDSDVHMTIAAVQAPPSIASVVHDQLIGLSNGMESDHAALPFSGSTTAPQHSVPLAGDSDSGRLLCGNCHHDHVGGDAVKKQLLSASILVAPSVAHECTFCNCVVFASPVTAGPSADKLFAKVASSLRSVIGRAMIQFQMLKDGDRVLVGLSGGKDSLCLLHHLLSLKHRAPIKFELAAATVDPQTPEYDPSPLIAYCTSIGVPYFYESRGIMAAAASCMDPKNVSICSFCSRMKRGVLYQVCRRERYNVLALGQHLDDLAESFIMSAFFNGRLQTMKANYLNDQGDVRIIRPMVFARETLTRQYARLAQLPVINENCPACYEEPKVPVSIGALSQMCGVVVTNLALTCRRGSA